MKKFISIILSVFMLFTMFGSVLAADAKTALVFSDVDAKSAEGAAIYKLAQNGIVEGNGDGTFAPNRYVKRAELCKMVNNIWSYTDEGNETFTDVNSEKWYYKHVRIAKKAGYINGFEDGTFRGEDYVTREQACAILVRVAKLYDLGLPVTISDKVSAWAENYVKTVIANTFISLENGNKFRATEPMTRAEFALMVDDFVVVKTPDVSINTGSSNTGSSNTGSSNTGSSKPGSSNTGSSKPSKPSEDENNEYPGIEEPEQPEEIFDEAKQKEVVENLNALLEEFDIIESLPWITFTEKENAVLDVIKATVKNTLEDAEKGKWIYVEDYVYNTYKSDVDSVRLACDEMKENGEFEDFKTKLKELPIYLLEYLSETMFGINAEDYM